MKDYLIDLLSSIKLYLSQDESFYLVESLLIIFVALVVDLFQKKILSTLKAKSENTKTIWDDVFLGALPKPLSIIIWVSSITYVAETIEEATKKMIFYEAFAPARKVGVILGLVLFFVKLINETENKFSLESEVPDQTTIHALAKLGHLVVSVAGGLMILQAFGFSVTGLLAFGGVGGIAIGLAAQDLLANFFGGLFIYTDRPFKVGDWIRSSDREIEGTVERIGWRVTRIRTFDKRPLYIPNSVFSKITVENPSRMENRRIKETIGIRYNDADKMGTITGLVRKMLLDHPEIDTEKTLMVNFNTFAPSSMDFFIYTFTKTTDWIKYHEIKQDVLLKILAIIEKQGAECAFPTSTIYMPDNDMLQNTENMPE